MIRKDDLLDAIAECQGQRNPNANTCIKLASYLTILEHVDKQNEVEAPVNNIAYSYADSELTQKLAGKTSDDIMAIFIELMETLEVLNPRLYQSVLRKL